MLTLRGIVVFVLSLSFLVFVALFGRLPALRGTPISFLYRTLWIRIPRVFRRVDSILTGGRGSRVVGGFWEYLLYRNHPVVMILYLIILTGSAILFIPTIYPTLSSGQLSLLLFLLILPYFFTYLCASSTASTIAPNSDTTAHESRRLYPYDHIIFYPRNICRTCKIPKPARSKHCSFCDCCVTRMDHHCHWITNCVGRANYVSFMFLLLSLHALLVYAAYLAYAETSRRLALVDKYNTYKDDLAVSFSPSSIDTVRAYFTSRINLFNRCLQLGGLRIGGVGLLCTLTSPLPAFMFGYHIYLLWAGMTTNESDKWANLREDMRDGLVYRGLLNNHGEDDVDFHQYRNINSNQRHNCNGRRGGGEKESTWPNRSRYMILVLDNDNSFNSSSSNHNNNNNNNNNNEMPIDIITQSPSEAPAHIVDRLSNTVDPASWKRVWHLSEVENIYDVGFWTALADVWSGWDCRL